MAKITENNSNQSSSENDDVKSMSHSSKNHDFIPDKMNIFDKRLKKFEEAPKDKRNIFTEPKNKRRSASPVSKKAKSNNSSPLLGKIIRTLVVLAVPITIILSTLRADKAQFEGNRNGPITPKTERQKVKEVIADFKESKETVTENKFESDNYLIQRFEGQKFDDWAQVLEDSLENHLPADFWRDVGNSSSSNPEHDILLRVTGGRDADGNARLTREDVIEFKEYNENKDISLSNKTSSAGDADFTEDNSNLDFSSDTEYASLAQEINLGEEAIGIPKGENLEIVFTSNAKSMGLNSHQKLSLEKNLTI